MRADPKQARCCRDGVGRLRGGDAIEFGHLCAIPHRQRSAAPFILSTIARTDRLGGDVQQCFGIDWMKTSRMIGTPHAGMPPLARSVFLRSSAQRVAIYGAPRRLQRALAQMEELQQALASSRQASFAARQQVALLTDTNARLRESAVQREQEVAKVRHFAYHDALTGLPNRALLLDRLNQALVQAKRKQKPLALLLLDLDGFKDINDRLGHDAGDKLLRRVAERLQSCIRGGDTACRYGGDEFVLLLPEVDDANRAFEVAEKIRVRLAKRYVVDGSSMMVTASIGVAVYAGDGMSPNDLIKQADGAMYLAKTLKNSSKTHAGTTASRWQRRQCALGSAPDDARH